MSFWNSPLEPPEPAKVVSASAAQTPPSTCDGGQNQSKVGARRASVYLKLLVLIILQAVVEIWVHYRGITVLAEGGGLDLPVPVLLF